MSTEDVIPAIIEEKVLPKLPSAIVEIILQSLRSQKDLKNCRLVCYKWLCIVNEYVGLGLKLNKTNKAKVFESELIRSCTSLKIHKSAGLANWKVGVVFSPWNLKSVEILENIQEDNWRLLLTQCKGVQFITIVATVISYNQRTKNIKKKETAFAFEPKITEKIDHCSLKRLVFKGIFDKHDQSQKDSLSMANMMNAIGTAPQLRQIVIVTCYINYVLFPHDAIVKDSIMSLLQRNPGIHNFGSVMNYSTTFAETKIWDELLQENCSCFAYNSAGSEGWRELLDRMLNIDILYYGILGNEVWIGFCTFLSNIMRHSRNLKTLYIMVGSLPNFPWVLDCSDIEQTFKNLKKLSVSVFYMSSLLNPLSPILENLNVLTSNNSLLEYLDISMQLTEENLTAIFNIPKLAELHIRFQHSSEAFNEQHCQLIRNHSTLKLIFWQKKFQTKWMSQVNEGNLQRNWQSFKMQPKKVLEIKGSNASDPVDVMTTDNGFIPLKSWKENGFDETFAPFNEERLTQSDRDRLRENYY